MIRSIVHLTLLLLFQVGFVACGKPTSANQQSEESADQIRQDNVRVMMDEADQIASLIDPGKLANLRERGANSRIQKITAILATAKARGKSPEKIAQNAITQIGWGNSPKGDLTSAAIMRNLTIAERLGSTSPEDIAAMKKGNAAIVRRGPYAGDILSVDHIIPRFLAPELDNTIANLELMPLRLNQSKGDKIGDRQRDLAKKLHAAGLLANPNISNP